MPGRGIEPPRVAPYGPEPYASTSFAIQAYPFPDQCRRQESNLQGLPHTHLKRARLPISPLRHKLTNFSKLWEIYLSDIVNLTSILVFVMLETYEAITYRVFVGTDCFG